MNWYDVIKTFDESGAPPYPFVADEEELFGRKDEDFLKGDIIKDWNERSLLRGTDPEYDGRTDDLLGNPSRLPVFSERLRLALIDAGVASSDIQFLPIRVVRTTGEELHGFAVANIVSRVAALDRDQSFMLELDYEKIDLLTGKPDVKGLGRAALKADALHGHDIIRLLEFFPAVFVSERFVKVFKSHRFTGARFNPVTVI